jgi:hypothetical protein
MTMSDRTWRILTATTIALLALVIIYFPESEKKQSFVAKGPFPFERPPNIFQRTDLGSSGAGVVLPSQLPENIQQLVNEGWKSHGFNQYVSDIIPIDRKLDDLRSLECKAQAKTMRKKFPKTSVIIIFHNEAWSTLLRSVHSVLDRTPAHLIQEILLVDDFSDMG